MDIHLEELKAQLTKEIQINQQNERRIFQLEWDISIREERIRYLEEELESILSLSSQEKDELQKEISNLKKSLYQARKEIRQKEKDLTTRENQLGEFDVREKKLKHRIKELSTSGRNSPQTYNQLVEMTDTIEQLRNENQTLRQYLADRNNQIARQKRRITDLHCQNFAIRLLHYRDRHELYNTQNALQTAEATNQNLHTMLEVPDMERSFMSGSSTDDSHYQRLGEGLERALEPGQRHSRMLDEILEENISYSENSDETNNETQYFDTNSPDIYNQDFEMATILELADAIDGYLAPQDRQILQNQIKRTTRQIRRKYNTQQQIIADLRTERDDITLERNYYRDEYLQLKVLSILLRSQRNRARRERQAYKFLCDYITRDLLKCQQKYRNEQALEDYRKEEIVNELEIVEDDLKV